MRVLLQVGTRVRIRCKKPFKPLTYLFSKVPSNTRGICETRLGPDGKPLPTLSQHELRDMLTGLQIEGASADSDTLQVLVATGLRSELLSVLANNAKQPDEAALSRAVMTLEPDIVKMLLDYGAKPTPAVIALAEGLDEPAITAMLKAAL